MFLILGMFSIDIEAIQATLPQDEGEMDLLKDIENMTINVYGGGDQFENKGHYYHDTKNIVKCMWSHLIM